MGCSPWGHEELDVTEQLHFHFSLSCIEEGNGNPLQCSCLENPRDGGAWWAAVYRVTQSRTRLFIMTINIVTFILDDIILHLFQQLKEDGIYKGLEERIHSYEMEG